MSEAPVIEMTDSKVRWIISGFAFLIAAAYFIWLCMVYARFMETDEFVRTTVAEHYASTVQSEVVPEKECEDCPDASESPGV